VADRGVTDRGPATRPPTGFSRGGFVIHLAKTATAARRFARDRYGLGHTENRPPVIAGLLALRPGTSTT